MDNNIQKEKNKMNIKNIVEKSGLFDKVFYLKTYRDARLSDKSPIDHYCEIGIKEDRKPNKDFDSVWYREYYKDIQKDEFYPFIHYALFGINEDRFLNKEEEYEYKNMDNSDKFDVGFYKNTYEDLKRQDDNFNFLLHYIRYGKSEGRKTKKKDKSEIIKEVKDTKRSEGKNVKLNKTSDRSYKEDNQLLNFRNFYFIQKKYLTNNLNAIFNTYEKYLQNKSPEELNSLLVNIGKFYNTHKRVGIMNDLFLYTFNEKSYLNQNKDVKRIVENKKNYSGLEHLLIHGWDEVEKGERRLYSDRELFNEVDYLSKNQDIKKAIEKKKIHSALQHFIMYGESNTEKESKNKQSYRNGSLKTNSKLKTVIICAHVVGKTLFGSERSLLDMIEGASESYNVILLAPMMNEEYFSYAKKYITRLYVVPFKWWKNDIATDEEVVKKIEKVIINNNVNIIHANTVMLREVIQAGKKVGIPTVTHIRELITGDTALCNYIGLSLDQVINEVVGRSDYFIGNSNATLEAYDLSNDQKSYLLYNTLNSDMYEAKKLDTDNISIGIISSNIPKKGIFDFAEVAKLCSDQKNLIFKIIGPENEYTDKIKEMKIDNLKICGYRKTPQDAMKELDIILSLSNFTESFGRTVAEGMASYKPIVAYKWGAVPELIEHKKTGFLVDYRDIQAVADHLKDFASNPKSIVSMGFEGRDRVEQNFDLPIYKKRLMSIYDSILQKEKDIKINIGYFLWHFPVPSETFVLNELRKLVQLNYDVKVYCKQSPFKEFEPDFPVTWERIESIEHFAELLIKDQRNIVHSHFTYPTVTDMVWPACEKAKIPFTFIAHAQDIFRYTNEEKNRIDEIAKSEWCYKVFVPARFHFDYLTQRGVSPEKMVINPNSVDPDLYIDGLSTDHSNIEKKSICAIHRFTEKKGLTNLIKAAKLFEEDITVNIYGYGDLGDEYKQTINDQKISNVHIKGGVGNREEMLQVFSEHDLFACPSIRAKDGDMDGIPTVLMEAMASGIPVLTTDISGIPDLVTDELTGVVTKSTPEDIAKDVKRFYNFPNSKIKAISENSRQLIESKFNTRYLVDNLLRVWEQKTIDLIIVSWNNLPELQEVTHRLLKYTTLPFRLIICDNLSEKNVRDFLHDLEQSHEEITVIFNDSNDMVGPGTNKALEAGQSDYAIYVCGKEGFTFDYGWEIPLVKYMEQNPKVGQAGTLGYSPTYLYGKDYPAGVALFEKFRNKQFATDNSDRIFKHAQGGFFIMRRKMYEEIGGFSYDVPHNYTDVEYSYYIESCGWELGEIPEMLVLFNKTRPGLFARMDETMHAMHPPMLDDLPKIDRIVQKKVKLCNICEWSGDAFYTTSEGLHLCPQCGSCEKDRALFRYIAGSEFTHRRIPAFSIGLGAPMLKFWKEQFQGRILNHSTLSDELKTTSKINNADGKTYLIYMNSFSKIDSTEQKKIIKEFHRLLHNDGEFILHLNNDTKDIDTEISKITSLGFKHKSSVRYCSQVCQYDWNKLLIFKKGNL